MWSFFWLVAAWLILLGLAATWLAAYMGIIVVLVVVILIVVTAYKVIKFIRSGRSNYS